MCQKDLASYRLRLLLSRPNADEIVNNLKLAFTGQPYHGYNTLRFVPMHRGSTYQLRCAYSDPMVPFRVFRLFASLLKLGTH